MKTIDLHVHSSCSDGTFSPTELVQQAAKIGLSAFALTDHDCTSGMDEALQAASDLTAHLRVAPEVVPGIELSTRYLNTSVHIIGLDIDYRSSQFQKELAALRSQRLTRNQKMIRLMADDGIRISIEAMTEAFGDGVWTRAHFARYLKMHGYVRDMQEAFVSYIGKNCRYYVEREELTPFQALELLQRFHGITLLAHPLQYHFSDEQLQTFVSALSERGLSGMEVYYSTHTIQDEHYLQAIADRYHLLPGGGSDFHGSNKPAIALGTGMGNLFIPYTLLEQLRTKSE